VGGVSTELVSPYPWFGGKRRAASAIWSALGTVDNYVEPFFGSGAVLLSRPGGAAGIETVNDADGMIANFWRALAAEPEAVARWADWPVSEVDLSARHLWLVGRKDSLAERLGVDPDYYDPKIAGWWVWGICAWIGSGWCSGEGPWTSDGERWVHRDDLGNAGRGIADYLAELSDRVRRVRVCCGDWERVVSDSVTWRHGTTGVVLDAPYPEGFDAEEGCYAAGGGADVWHASAAWAAKAGQDRRLRIVVCGYEGTWTPPDGWATVEWTARKGYAGEGNDDRRRERIWTSPACVRAGHQVGLFG